METKKLQRIEQKVDSWKDKIIKPLAKLTKIGKNKK
jgi:hypothetical protein